jgi:hypothetical protein
VHGVQWLVRRVRIVLTCEKPRRYSDKVLRMVSIYVFSDEHRWLPILKLGTLPNFEVLPLHLDLISGVVPQESLGPLFSYSFSSLFGKFSVRFLRLMRRRGAVFLGRGVMMREILAQISIIVDPKR